MSEDIKTSEDVVKQEEVNDEEEERLVVPEKYLGILSDIIFKRVATFDLNVFGNKVHIETLAGSDLSVVSDIATDIIADAKTYGEGAMQIQLQSSIGCYIAGINDNYVQLNKSLYGDNPRKCLLASRIQMFRGSEACLITVIKDLLLEEIKNIKKISHIW